jgi:hypothetical protein
MRQRQADLCWGDQERLILRERRATLNSESAIQRSHQATQRSPQARPEKPRRSSKPCNQARRTPTARWLLTVVCLLAHSVLSVTSSDRSYLMTDRTVFRSSRLAGRPAAWRRTGTRLNYIYADTPPSVASAAININKDLRPSRTGLPRVERRRGFRRCRSSYRLRSFLRSYRVGESAGRSGLRRPGRTRDGAAGRMRCSYVRTLLLSSVGIYNR